MSREGKAVNMGDDAYKLVEELLAGRMTRRELIVRATVLGLSTTTIGALLAACGTSNPTSTAAATPRPGGVLRAGLTGGSSSDTLDPHMGLSYLDTARATQVYQPLLRLNAAAQTEFELAEEISPHGSTSEWIIRLRSGVTFHDGKPLTADDLIYTLQRILNPKAPLTGATSLGPVDLKGLRKVDNLTVIVPMTSPFGSFIDQLSYWYYLYIVPTGFNPAKPNGTGPFKYQSFTAGQQSTYVKNTNYWKSGLPYVDSVTIIDFADSASLANALVANQIDAAGALEGAQLKVLSSNAKIKTVASHTGSITPFTMRVDQAPFNDVRVRQAFRFMVNRQQLISAALDGDASVGADVSSPYDPDYDSSLHREQDIPRAKSLLQAAGRSNLAVELVTSPAATGMVQMATVLAQQAKQAGVTINLKVVDPSTFFGPNYLKWTFSQDFYNYSPYLAQVAQSLLPTSPFNETHWSDPNYQSLYTQANATLDAAMRRDLEKQMQQIDFNQGGYIIPCFIDSLDAYSTKLAGYTAAKVGQPLSLFDFEHFGFI
jgi:peptide/nickel transport system substrate-binding protein